MLVVNRAINGQFFIFRGKDAEVFLAGLELQSVTPGTLILAGGGRVPAALAFTTAHTAVVALESENFTDAGAKAAFTRLVDCYDARERRKLGHIHS